MDRDNRVFSLSSTEDLKDLQGAGTSAIILIFIAFIVILLIGEAVAPNLIPNLMNEGVELVMNFMDKIAQFLLEHE